ncbi:MAG: hypothetical protein R6U50_00510 [Desulfobacterales bacterium]
MKICVVLSWFVVLPIFFCPDASGSWLVDLQRYHVSVHGQTACTDCHVDIDPGSHPDPANVTKSPADLFSPESCASCHDAVADFIALGEHGGKTVQREQDIENCLACHDPHYQLGFGIPDEFDPEAPVDKQCGVCHESESRLPSPYSSDQSCVVCHELPPAGTGRNESIAAFCFYCHAETNRDRFDPAFPMIDAERYTDTAHADLSCMACHPESAEYGHGEQPLTDCRRCHDYHDEKTLHDAHVRVSCRACHLSGVMPVKAPVSGIVHYRKAYTSGVGSSIHEMRLADEGSCRRCHYTGNELGASAMVLPAKSIICMPCHTATLSIGDWVTLASLAVFALGLISFFYVFSAGLTYHRHEEDSTRKSGERTRKAIPAIFFRRIASGCGALFWDVLCQRKLFYKSPGRWAVHALIFYPFIIRFSWGIAALVMSKTLPNTDLTRAMLDKNHPFGAFLFDITGLMVIFGAFSAAVSKSRRPAAGFKHMPGQDWIGISILSAIVIVGFIIEGMRIAMTGFPAGAEWSFLGYATALLFTGMTGIADIYGYMWYVHAVFTGLFIAYLPFGRMLHMITAPVLMIINGFKKEKE